MRTLAARKMFGQKKRKKMNKIFDKVLLFKEYSKLFELSPPSLASMLHAQKAFALFLGSGSYNNMSRMFIR
jgi:hypothetical protein